MSLGIRICFTVYCLYICSLANAAPFLMQLFYQLSAVNSNDSRKFSSNNGRNDGRFKALEVMFVTCKGETHKAPDM